MTVSPTAASRTEYEIMQCFPPTPNDAVNGTALELGPTCLQNQAALTGLGTIESRSHK